MADEIEVKIGTFNLDSTNKVAIADLAVAVAKSIKQSPLAKTGGSIIPIGKRKSIIIRLSGTIVGSNYDALRTNLDALHAAFEHVSAEQKFTIDDDRFLRVQGVSFGYNWPSSFRTLANFTVSMIASDPFWLSETLTSDSTVISAAPSQVINNPGNAPTRVKITVTNASNAINDDLKIQNTTIGETMQYRGNIVATKEFVANNMVDDKDLVVTNDGVDDIVNFEGDFLTLNPGNNTIVLTTAVALTVVKLEFREANY